jgi:hypothetical protein
VLTTEAPSAHAYRKVTSGTRHVDVTRSPSRAALITLDAIGGLVALQPGIDRSMASKRAPDPFRPGHVPEGRHFAKVGRPGTAVLVVWLIVAVGVAVIVYGLVR